MSVPDPILARVFTDKAPAEVEALYDEWAETYEADTAEVMGYTGPDVAADRIAELVDDCRTPVLDAGCGTGLVGVALRRHGFSVLDGYDISGGMLAKASGTGAYRTLAKADLTGRLPADDATYGVVVCVGTLTEGHVGPEALAELARVTRPGGLVVATIVEHIWESLGYAATVDALATQGVAALLEAESHPIRVKQDVRCRLAVLQVAG